MVSVIFEVWPDPAHREGYLNWAAELHAELLKMDGFISILTNGKVTGDNVGPHKDLLPSFPYLGVPHKNRSAKRVAA